MYNQLGLQARYPDIENLSASLATDLVGSSTQHICKWRFDIFSPKISKSQDKILMPELPSENTLPVSSQNSCF